MQEKGKADELLQIIFSAIVCNIKINNENRVTSSHRHFHLYPAECPEMPAAADSGLPGYNRR